MTSPAITVLPPGQQAVLRQALADAVNHRDPPLNCRTCEASGQLCRQCSAGLARARTYFRLAREFGISPHDLEKAATP
jgi:hypothetical protein